MTKPPSPRPLSIKILAILFALAAIAFAFRLRSGATFAGDSISGPPALIHNIIMALLQAYLAVGLWKLQELARRIAIGADCYGALTIILVIVRHPEVIANVAFMIFCTTQLTVIALAIWFLIKRKSAFVKPRTAP